MTYPSQLTDTPSITDGYVLWPHWMQSIFAETLGWPIDKLFYVCFWTFTAIMFGCLILAWWLRRSNTYRWPRRLLGLTFVVMLCIWPFFDSLWINHEYKRVCSTLAGIHIYKNVEADGYISYGAEKPLTVADAPSYPERQKTKDQSWKNVFNIGDKPEQFRFAEMRYLPKGSAPDAKVKIMHFEWRDGRLMETTMEKPTARYMGIHAPHQTMNQFRKIGYNAGIYEMRIVDLKTQEIIARHVLGKVESSWLSRQTHSKLGSRFSDCTFAAKNNSSLMIENEGALTREVELYKELGASGDFVTLTLRHYPETVFKLVFLEKDK